MTKGIIACQFLGRFGNCLFSYAFARSYAERNNLELQTDPWIGQRVFGLNDPPIDNPDSLQRVDENTIQEGMTNILYRSYSQQQKCLTYTRKDCLRWFRFSEEIENLFLKFNPLYSMAHRRDGDYAPYGYPVVSKESYRQAASQFDVLPPEIITEDSSPYPRLGIPEEFRDVLDFYMFTKAAVFFRGNSTYSWWAATLSNAKVFAPIMKGCQGGKENHCFFTEGNWPAFRHDLPFLTDLHLKEE